MPVEVQGYQWTDPSQSEAQRFAVGFPPVAAELVAGQRLTAGTLPAATVPTVGWRLVGFPPVATALASGQRLCPPGSSREGGTLLFAEAALVAHNQTNEDFLDLVVKCHLIATNI